MPAKHCCGIIWYIEPGPNINMKPHFREEFRAGSSGRLTGQADTIIYGIFRDVHVKLLDIFIDNISRCVSNLTSSVTNLCSYHTNAL